MGRALKCYYRCTVPRTACRIDPALDVRGAKVEAPWPSWWCPHAYFSSFPLLGRDELSKGNFHLGQEGGAADCPAEADSRMGGTGGRI